MPLLQNSNNKNLSNLSKTFQNEMKIAFTWIHSKLQRRDELVAKAFQSIYMEILGGFTEQPVLFYGTEAKVGIWTHISLCNSNIGTLFQQSHLSVHHAGNVN